MAEEDTDFTDVNLDATILPEARYTKGIRWPEGFDPASRGAVLVVPSPPLNPTAGVSAREVVRRKMEGR